MKGYIVMYYNRFVNENQVFNVDAENKFRAGREFYRKHNRKAYRSCIEHIYENYAYNENNRVIELMTRLYRAAHELDYEMCTIINRGKGTMTGKEYEGHVDVIMEAEAYLLSKGVKLE